LVKICPGKPQPKKAIEAVDKIERFVLEKIDLPFENEENSLEGKGRNK